MTQSGGDFGTVGKWGTITERHNVLVCADPSSPRSTGNVVVRPMSNKDVRFATTLHLQSLNHGLFPAMGKGFLGAYLRTFVSSPFAIALIAERDGEPIGYLVGTEDDRAHYGHVIRTNWPSLAPRGLVALVVRPAVAIRFARTRAARYARGAVRLTGKTDARGPSVKDASLTHMAVSARCRGQGVGKALVAAFLEALSQSNAKGVRLLTRSNSAGAGRFYEKLGWCLVTEFTDQDGVKWLRYRRDPGPSSASC